MSQEWWRDPRCHFGELTLASAFLHRRDDIQPAIEFICAEFGAPSQCTSPRSLLWNRRYAVESAHRSYDVVGLDINEQCIALARQFAEREGAPATFLLGDMWEIPFERHFDAIINVGTSFGFFDSEVENHRVIKAVAKALTSTGSFLLEMGNRDYYLKHFQAKDWRKLENGQIIIQREFNYVRSRIESIYELVGSAGVERWSHSWRAYTLAEVVGMVHQAGLTVSCVYGSWERSHHSVNSPRMVIVSKRKGAG